MDDLNLVGTIAKAYYRRVKDWWPYEYDDLFNAGVIGLMQAKDRFDKKNGTSFKTFASYRISGAILDEIRDADMRSRSERKRNTAVTMLSLDDILELGYLPQDSCACLLLKVIDEMPEDLKILCWKRIRGKSYRQIGKDLNLTESRICQIFNEKILPRLRTAIE